MNGVVITRGLRNHNPGNLKWFASIPWRGQTGHDADGYATFSADFYGLRAMAKNIIAAVVNHHCLNLDALIPRYAPSADNNDVQAYIADVEWRSGIERDADLAVLDINVLRKLMHAMIYHENGKDPFSDSDIDAAIYAAYY